MNLLQPFLQFYRRTRCRLTGTRLGAPRYLAAGIDWHRGAARANVFGEITLGPGAWIEQGAVFNAFGGSIRLGRDVFVGPHAVIYGHGGVEIGDACLIAMHCRIVSSNHTVPPLGTDIRSQPDLLLPTRIGRDVWLGAGVTVLGGVTVGASCVVGAGAIVTKDLPPGSISHGVPAKVTGWREGAIPA
jgi:acetyltransferase-like isoleucine patch superfamily enzyme